MIGLSYNDYPCLGAISETVAAMVGEHDPALLDLADTYRTRSEVIDYIRSLPQRDDLGDPADGPRIQIGRAHV